MNNRQRNKFRKMGVRCRYHGSWRPLPELDICECRPDDILFVEHMDCPGCKHYFPLTTKRKYINQTFTNNEQANPQQTPQT